MILASFLGKYGFAILFYALILLLIYKYRKKFEIQHNILALYRTKFGLNFMKKIANKYNKAVRFYGYSAIVFGVIGFIFIIILLAKSFLDLFLKPELPASVVPLIPGVQIGSIFLPFWIGIISIFIVALVHEFSHGVVAIAHNLKLKSSGFGMFLLFPIAFVEPSEKDLKKQKASVQNSVFAAGPFANLVLGALVLVLSIALLTPAMNAVAEKSTGIEIVNVTKDFPAEQAGIAPGSVVSQLNNYTITSYESFLAALVSVKPNETINITANGNQFALTTVPNPNNKDVPYMGVLVNPKGVFKDGFYNNLNIVLFWIRDFFAWLFVISIGIGLINLFPIFITDGARMLQTISLKFIKNEIKSQKFWHNFNAICLLILVMNLFVPFVRWLIKLLF